jgi:hypothetical protein
LEDDIELEDKLLQADRVFLESEQDEHAKTGNHRLGAAPRRPSPANKHQYSVGRSEAIHAPEFSPNRASL